MSTLVSPGVSVSVIDESFYSTSGVGTVPLIVFATAANKASPTGTGIAPGTLPSTAQQLYLVTSQRELIQTFGNPIFQSVQGTSVHGHELNEYGLHAAYQYLGISSRAYVMRADIDTAQLAPSVSAPKGAPLNGTYWFDLNTSVFGVHQSTGAAGSLDPFLKQDVLVVYSPSEYDANNGKPLSGLGEDGDFAIVTAEANNRIFEKIAGVWYLAGSSTWKMARNIVQGTAPMAAVQTSDSFAINGVTFVITSTTPAGIAADVNAAIANAPSLAGRVQMSSDSAGRLKLNYNLPAIQIQNVTGTPLAAFKIAAGTYNSVKLTFAKHNQTPANSVAGDVWIKTTSSNNGAVFTVKQYSSTTATFSTIDAPLYPSNAAAAAALGSNPTVGTLYVQYNQEGTDDAPLGGFEIMRWGAGVWAGLNYEEDFTTPSTDPEEGTLWYNTDLMCDIMVNDGNQWLGYRNMYPATDPNGIQLTSVAPITQSDDTPLVDNDLWLDTSDTENYPKIYRYNATTSRWSAVDNTDQTTPYGIVFADVRANSGGEYTNANNTYTRFSTTHSDMVLSNYVDPDAPNPEVHTGGIMLFNTRYSTNNVKQWMPNYFGAGVFDADTDFTTEVYTVGDDQVQFQPVISAGRWVTASGNQTNGSPYMGRKAVRQMIVEKLSAIIAGNEDIRSELVYFNLVSVPGYPECIDEMVILNTDQKEVAFIVGDTPARLKPDGTSISKWATNANNASSNSDEGLTTHNANIGIYYPWGLSTNIDGTEIMVPPSTIALRTIAYNDSVAYPWFAPAGFTRGLVSNAASVGYLTDEGEYEPVILNQGQRDTMQLNNINPIAYIPNRGLVVYGQKTLSPVSSALDRINVARLVNYMRYQLDVLAKPFLFEPNDAHTRDSFRITIERFLMGLVGLRALEDFAVVCDTSNNTAERRDANELWADIAIKPVKAVEFIYLPIRIRNSGDSLDLL